MGREQLNIRFSPDDDRLLMETATALGTSRSETVRRAIREMHERHGGLARTRLVETLTGTYGYGARITFVLDGDGGTTATVDPGDVEGLGGLERTPLHQHVGVDLRTEGDRTTIELRGIEPDTLDARVFIATVPRGQFTFTVNVDDFQP